MRVEDLDGPRVVAGAEARQLEDLRWLGLDWDEGPDVGGGSGPYRQSERLARYDAAIADLSARGHTFACDCSRREIAQIASAPHAGDDGPRYPGTCRDRAPTATNFRRPPAVRLRVPDGTVHLRDRLQPPTAEDVAAVVGDFVLRRGDGVHAYQLAVVVDDLAMGITEIVRGADLLGSTARQTVLARLLGAALPPTCHVPLFVSADGTRLGKRAGSRSLREQRAAGTAPEVLIGALAHALGLQPSAAPTAARALLATFERARLVRQPTVHVPPTLLG